ncbi:chromosome transmission fidelity protein 8 homolog [Euwallacea similis]|uniref:chromosome transmission fidelity protein 8 homolog n=1 Tax=Euwallacea similis TaxID=1736056 RepID=UPI00344D5B27
MFVVENSSHCKTVTPIFIKCAASEDYSIIELQGDLKSHSGTEFEGKFIGDLHYTKQGQPILIIGHHLLYGKEVKMEKPLALLQKGVNERGDTEYSVRCVIRQKIIFKTRPKPIVGTS